MLEEVEGEGLLAGTPPSPRVSNPKWSMVLPPLLSPLEWGLGIGPLNSNALHLIPHEPPPPPPPTTICS